MLSAEQIYNDLDGESVKEILLIRCADILNQVAEFNRNYTLPRVRMTLSVHLEIFGRTPPVVEFQDDLVVRMHDSITTNAPTLIDQEVIIDADPSHPDGQHPDIIRAEHGLPNMIPVKGPAGNIEDKPVIDQSAVRYAFNVTQDYGPARGRTGAELPVVGGELIAQKNAGASPDTSPNLSRVADVNYEDRYDSLDANGQK